MFHNFSPQNRCIPVLLLALLTACSDSATEYSSHLLIFGTVVDIKLRGVGERRATEAVAAVDEDFQKMHRDWHAWKPGELTKLNRSLPAGEPHSVSAFLLPLITQSQQLFEQSDGLFNPAIGKLIALWGFHSDDLPSGPPPPSEAIAKLVAQVPRMDDLEINGNQVRSNNPAVDLDFGGFAKGYALNIAIDRLREFGVDNAIINAGGDLCVSGRHGDRPWRVGVRHPQGQGLIALVDTLDGECVLTSGNYERYREHAGVRYPHILDPRDGLPVRHIASATVIDKDGGAADAAATALTVAGPKDWYPIAKQMKLKYVMLVDEDGTVYMNPAMAARMDFQDHEPERIVVSDPL
ncbi:FAD:protein FMN transferase [hydrothermal vent metagenome]|uniref:FAD:protein FMN transferase n=1 Tax=hydrothermal vent metagenome TaxID=652676 RepID=A0A3B1BT75_9ZZZZ